MTCEFRVIRTAVRGISVIGRNNQGVRLIDLAEGERVVGVARLTEEEEDEEPETPPTVRGESSES